MEAIVMWVAMSAAPDARLIDVRHLGRERVIGCWSLGGALVDPGPESCLETLLEGLGCEPEALLLTHIHLDHAGASGALVERFPNLDVYVHANGAPHLIDPSKLLQSAERIYGDDMDRLWGRFLPVPERNLKVLKGGETIEVAGREIDVLYAPGHASHHVVYLDRADRTAYLGDVGGVRVPPVDRIVPPTPPPDIDVPLWQDSLRAVAELRPSRLAFTHFGSVDEPDLHLDRMAQALDAQAELVRGLLDEVEEGAEEPAMRSFVEVLEREAREQCDLETVLAYEQAAPPSQLWLGLRRYWKKQDVAQNVQ
jgi:glyoxylase-like metal-dependent hydrolase (beta-lactamase superfamily II)